MMTNVCYVLLPPLLLLAVHYYFETFWQGSSSHASQRGNPMTVSKGAGSLLHGRPNPKMQMHENSLDVESKAWRPNYCIHIPSLVQGRWMLKTCPSRWLLMMSPIHQRMWLKAQVPDGLEWLWLKTDSSTLNIHYGLIPKGRRCTTHEIYAFTRTDDN